MATAFGILQLMILNKSLDIYIVDIQVLKVVHTSDVPNSDGLVDGCCHQQVWL